MWKPTKELRFPFNLPVPPDGYIELRNDWAKLRSSDDEIFNQYLLKLTIESHRLDNTFLLTEKVSPSLFKTYYMRIIGILMAVPSLHEIYFVEE